MQERRKQEGERKKTREMEKKTEYFQNTIFTSASV